MLFGSILFSFQFIWWLYRGLCYWFLIWFHLWWRTDSLYWTHSQGEPSAHPQGLLSVLLSPPHALSCKLQLLQLPWSFFPRNSRAQQALPGNPCSQPRNLQCSFHFSISQRFQAFVIIVPNILKTISCVLPIYRWLFFLGRVERGVHQLFCPGQ